MTKINCDAKQMPIVLMPLTITEVSKLTQKPYVLEDIYIVSGNKPEQLFINMYAEVDNSKKTQLNQWYFYNGKKILADHMIGEYLDRSFFEVMPTVDGKISDCKVLSGTSTLFEFVNHAFPKIQANKTNVKK